MTAEGPKKPRVSTAAPKQGGAGDAEADALWARITRDVIPLPGRQAARADRDTVHPAPPAKKGTGAAALRRVAPAPAVDVSATPSVSKAAELSHGRAPGLDRKTQTNLRRGKVEIEGRIDLHGLTRAEAHRALIAFVTASHDQGKRAVLVITGKGLKETGEVGVLRRAVPGWLNAPPLKPLVRAFDYAARQHGGEGAIYVLLKRRRDGRWDDRGGRA